MNKGFSVSQIIDRPPDEVWAYLVEFRNAPQWMTGVDGLEQVSDGPLGVGAELAFKSRGKVRGSVVSAFEPERRLDLTSTQGGITASYSYSLAPRDGATELTLSANCEAKGLWKILHPLIKIAMEKSDSSHVSNIATAMEG